MWRRVVWYTCTEISKEPAAYVIRVDEPADAVNMFGRTSDPTPPPPARSTVTVQKTRLVHVLYSAACHM